MIYIVNDLNGRDYPKRILECYIEEDFFAMLQCDKAGVPVPPEMKQLCFKYINQLDDTITEYIEQNNKTHYKICIDEKTYTFDDILENPELFCSLVEHENDLLALDILS